MSTANQPTTAIIRSAETKAAIAIFIGICFLAAGGILVKLSSTQPIATAFYRIFFSLPFIFLVLGRNKDNPQEYRQANPTIKEYGFLVLAGSFFGIDLSLYHMAFDHTTIVNANLFTNIFPFIVVPLAYFIFKERINPLFWPGAAMVVIGISLLLSGKANPSRDNFFGDMLAVVSALCYSVYFLTVAKSRNKFSVPVIMLWSAIGALLVLFPLSIIFETAIVPATWVDLSMLIALGLFCQFGGQGLITYALGYLKISVSAVMILLQPVMAAIFGYLIFAETLTWLEGLGGLVTLGGIYLAKKSN